LSGGVGPLSARVTQVIHSFLKIVRKVQLSCERFHGFKVPPAAVARRRDTSFIRQKFKKENTAIGVFS
jgi:hypothetical protein